MILAKTVKGWALGEAIEARNVTHQAKKMTVTDLQVVPRPARAPDRPIATSTRSCRRTTVRRSTRRRSSTCSGAGKELGGLIPERRVSYTAPKLPGKDTYDEFLTGTEDKKTEVATTQAFVRLLRVLLRDHGDRPAHRPDHPGRGAHVRHGVVLQGS